MMARPNHDTQRMDDLLASVTSDLIGELPQNLNGNVIRVDRILLEMVRPDPVQPRRVLPESIHRRFHQNQLTPTQALRELVQIVQIAARHRNRPFNNLLELLPNADDERDDEPAGTPPQKRHFCAIWSIWRSLFEMMGRSIR